MSTWLFLILALLFQETILTNTAILQARHDGINWFWIHFIWLVATIIDFVVPYYLGRHFFRRIKNNRLGKYLTSWGIKAKKLITRVGEIKGLFILGYFNFIYFNGPLAAWLGIDFKKAFVVFMIGDFIWYLSILWLNSIVVSFFPDEKTAILIFILVGVTLIVISKVVLKKLSGLIRF